MLLRRHHKHNISHHHSFTNPTLEIEVKADSATHHLANVIESSTRLSDSKVNKSCSDQMFGIYLVSSQIGIDLPSLSLFNSSLHRIHSSSSFVFMKCGGLENQVY